MSEESKPIRGIFLSIRPCWAEKIYRREKLYELRKTGPRDPEFLAQSWRPVYIYETVKRRITGVCGFGGEMTSETVEPMEMLPLCLSGDEIEAYGPGRDGMYHAWRMGRAEKYLTPFLLKDFGLKRPPQSWQYISLGRGNTWPTIFA